METSWEICFGNAWITAYDEEVNILQVFLDSLPPFVYLFQSTILLFDPHHCRNVETASDYVNCADLRSRSVENSLDVSGSWSVNSVNKTSCSVWVREREIRGAVVGRRWVAVWGGGQIWSLNLQLPRRDHTRSIIAVASSRTPAARHEHNTLPAVRLWVTQLFRGRRKK